MQKRGLTIIAMIGLVLGIAVMVGSIVGAHAERQRLRTADLPGHGDRAPVAGMPARRRKP
jgi:hypothetical protein